MTPSYWARQTDLTNFVTPRRDSFAKQRLGAEVIKKYDTAQTPSKRPRPDLGPLGAIRRPKCPMARGYGARCVD